MMRRGDGIGIEVLPESLRGVPRCPNPHCGGPVHVSVTVA